MNENEMKFLAAMGKLPLKRYQGPSSLGMRIKALSGEVYPFCSSFG